jgi:hypothetical protein
VSTEAPGEADSRTEELAALVDHALLDHLVGPQGRLVRSNLPNSVGIA